MCGLWGSTPALQNLGWRTANSYLFAPDRRHWWLRTESILPSPAWVTQKQLHLRKVSSSVCNDSQGLHSWCPLDSLQAAPLKKVSFCRRLLCVLCMCLCVCVCECVCVYVCLCLFVHACKSVSTCARMCASLCLCLCVCVWVFVCVHVCLCLLQRRGLMSLCFFSFATFLNFLSLTCAHKGPFRFRMKLHDKREKKPVKKTIHWGWRTSPWVRHKNMLKLPNKPSVLHPTRYHDCSFWEIAAYTLSPCNETQTPHGTAKWTANTQ